MITTHAFSISTDGNDVNVSFDSLGQTRKGKTYTLKLSVYLKNAPKDAKPIVVSYKVMIAK